MDLCTYQLLCIDQRQDSLTRFSGIIWSWLIISWRIVTFRNPNPFSILVLFRRFFISRIIIRCCFLANGYISDIGIMIKKVWRSWWKLIYGNGWFLYDFSDFQNKLLLCLLFLNFGPEILTPIMTFAIEESMIAHVKT